LLRGGEGRVDNCHSNACEAINEVDGRRQKPNDPKFGRLLVHCNAMSI
jgi:hypothetical protein